MKKFFMYIKSLKSDCNTEGKLVKFKIKEHGGKKIVMNYLVAKRGYNARYPIRFAKWNARDRENLRLDDQIALKIIGKKNPFLKTRKNIENLRKIESRRGLRHLVKLPVRGQRTRTNARTAKKKR